MAALTDRGIAFLVAPEGTEQVELTEPWQAGGRPVLGSTEPGQVQAFNHLDQGDLFPVDKVVIDTSGNQLITSRETDDLPTSCAAPREHFGC